MTLPTELTCVFWKLGRSYSESHFSSVHPFSRWSVTWSLPLLWTSLKSVCLRNGRRKRHMLAEEITLLCFLLSRLSYFPKWVKDQVMWYFLFFVSVTIPQMWLSLFFFFFLFFHLSSVHLDFTFPSTIDIWFLERSCLWLLPRTAPFAHVPGRAKKSCLILSHLWKISHKYPLAWIYKLGPTTRNFPPKSVACQLYEEWEFCRCHNIFCDIDCWVVLVVFPKSRL